MEFDEMLNDPLLHRFLPNCGDDPLHCWACGQSEEVHPKGKVIIEQEKVDV